MKHLPLLILATVLFIGCSSGRENTGSQQNETDEQQLSSQVETSDNNADADVNEEISPYDLRNDERAVHNLQEVMQSIITMDAKRLAKVTVFPIYQEYPMKDINNERDLQEAMPYLFDDSIRTILSNATIDDWDRVGWRGIMLYDGTYLWCDDFGCLRFVSYFSSNKEQYVSQLNEQEVYEGQDRNWKTTNCFLSLDSAYFVRVERYRVQDGDAVYRLHFLSRDSIDGYYSRELNYYGSLELEGSCCNEYYTFACTDSLVTLWVNSISCRGDMADVKGDDFVLEFPCSLHRPESLAGKRIVLQPAFWREVKKWW